MKISKIEYVILEEPKQYYDVVNVSDTHNFLIQTSSGYIVSHNCDEVSFQPNQDIEKQKQKAKTLISTADARMQSRFMKGEKLPTLHILASSKRTEQSFLESYIEMKKKNESKTTLIIDEPQWVIRTDKDSPQKFNVAVGNKFLNSELLPLKITEEELQMYRNRGYTILKVPMGYYENFRDDLDIALTDIAGISTSNSSRYISGERWSKCINKKAYNPFTKDIIEVGNSAEDIAQYYDFFDLTKIDSELKSRPLYVHLDMSVSGDKTGIAGVWIIGKKEKIEEGRPASKDLRYRLAFNTSIKAPKGHQVSFEKNRQFIFWLREQGFNIKGVSTDTFQSYDTGQTLKVKGFNYDIISVDRVDKDRICKPYQYFKTTIYDERIEIYETALLTEEVVGLKRDNNGKIDHDITGINCFTGDTLVSLVDGRQLTMIQLMKEHEKGKINYVYSFNETLHIIEPKKIVNAWCSGKDAKLLEVTLDNGETIRCTPNHRFMLRDGSYETAENLMINDSLMPLYTKYPSNESMKSYRMYYEPMENKWHYEHRKFATDVLDEKYLVHHKNFNSKDNTPDNLVWCSKELHQTLHSKEYSGAFSKSANKKRSDSIKMSHDKARKTDDGWKRYYSGTDDDKIRARNAKLKKIESKSETIRVINEYFDIDFESLDKDLQERYLGKYANLKAGKIVEKTLGKSKKTKKSLEKEQQILVCNYFNKNIDDLSQYELHSIVLKYIFATREGYKEVISSAISTNHKLGKYKNAELALSNRIWWTDGVNNVYIKDTQEPPTGYKRGRTMKWKNHKVVSVKVLNNTEDVYDIEVEDNHNFALSAGVFVHNSKDSADAVCGAVYNASQHAEEFAFDFGESLDTIAKTNIVNSNIRQQITTDFEAELKLLDPLAKFNEKEKQKEKEITASNTQNSQTHQSTIPEPKEVPNAYLYDGIIVW